MKLSIRRKLLIGFTLLLVLSSLIVSFTFSIIQQYISSQVTTILEVEANEGASEIVDFFTQLENQSIGLAKTYSQNQDTFVTLAKYTVQNSNFIEGVTVLTPAGHELLEMTPNGQLAQDRLSYEIYTDSFKSAVSGTPSISQVYYIAQDREPRIDTFYPIYGKNHRISGVVKMRVNLRLLRSKFPTIKLGNNGYIYVVDNNGLLISHPSQSYVLERPDLSSRKVIADALTDTNPTFQDEQYVNQENVPVIAKAVKVTAYNWVAVFEQPISEAFSFLIFIRNIFIVTLGVSFFFLLLIARFLSENLTRPIRKLQQSAELVESGKLDKIIKIKSGDEIESLSHSFSSLVDQLLQREHLLVNVSSELKVANIRLKALDKLKNEFVSVASHELRTPMTAIKSYLWMALKGKGGPLTDKQRYYVERSYNSADRLVRLVNDMLNISRIESGHITIDFQAVNLPVLIQEVVDEVLPHATELGVVIIVQKIPTLPPVLADPDKIKEVLFNLIGNSLKFTPRGGKIFINFAQLNGFIQTIITDTGSGIAPDDVNKLFQKFGLLPGSYITNQTTIAGTGLGLYICRSIVELHRGEIKAKSPGLGKGAKFTFTLRVFSEADYKEFKKSQSETDPDKMDLIHAQI